MSDLISSSTVQLGLSIYVCFTSICWKRENVDFFPISTSTVFHFFMWACVRDLFLSSLSSLLSLNLSPCPTLTVASNSSTGVLLSHAWCVCLTGVRAAGGGPRRRGQHPQRRRPDSSLDDQLYQLLPDSPGCLRHALLGLQPDSFLPALRRCEEASLAPGPIPSVPFWPNHPNNIYISIYNISISTSTLSVNWHTSTIPLN